MGLSLASYLQRTQRLLDDATFQRFNPYDLIEYVNEARLQVAGESQCIRAQGTVTTAIGQQFYLNSAITLPPNQGLGGTLSVVNLLAPGSPLVLMETRSWPWFQAYNLTLLGGTPPGTPTTWAQYVQGLTGSFYVSPPPSAVISLTADVVASPISLAPATTATDIDALIYPWTDAVAFFAANLALRGAKMPQEADELLAQYESYINRAKVNVTPASQARNAEDRPAANPLISPQQPPQKGGAA